jgi:hypothetical protein
MEREDIRGQSPRFILQIRVAIPYMDKPLNACDFKRTQLMRFLLLLLQIRVAIPFLDKPNHLSQFLGEKELDQLCVSTVKNLIILIKFLEIIF